MGGGDDGSRVDGALQVTGHNHVYLSVTPFLAECTGLKDTTLVESALRLTLHGLTGVIDGLAVPYKI